ncbi:hypothetical protein CI610_03024 [invertebrate metagenome]|uniref:Replication protein n=1 Tax=invertebrate metagenome TaxID=1711999 RepID=A0A2H9T4A5_9ZZZZ
MSQAEFIVPNRRVVNLARIGLLFADLDYYRRPYLKGGSVDQVADSLIWYCQNEANIPVPSLIISSGQGLQVKWLLEGTVPRQALPRWNACQRKIIDALAYFGADPMAKDASRVLRLVDTVNSKNDAVCYVVHVEQNKQGDPVRYDFEWLCENLLPVARWDIEDQKAKGKSARLKLATHTNRSGRVGLQGNKLAWDRLEDLRKLVQLRGGVPEGERMINLFWQLNFLLLSGATNANLMYHEAAALAKQINPDWNYRTAELSTLYEKAKTYNAGQNIEFNGKQYPALYTPRNDTLINTFRITDDEQAQLKTIISKNESRSRDKKRKLEQRRSSGMQSRAEYEKNAQNKRIQAIRLRAQGMTIRQIASDMQISKSQVQRYLL